MGSAWLTRDGFARVCGDGLYVSDEPCAAVCGGGCPGGQCCLFTSPLLGDVYHSWPYSFPASSYIGQSVSDSGCEPQFRLYGYQIKITGYARATLRSEGFGAPPTRTIDATYNATFADSASTCLSGSPLLPGRTVADSFGVVGSHTVDLGTGPETKNVYATREQQYSIFATPHAKSFRIAIRQFVAPQTSNALQFEIYKTPIASGLFCTILGRIIVASFGSWSAFSISIAANLSSGSVRIVGDNVNLGTLSGITTYFDDTDIDIQYELTPAMEVCDSSALMSPLVGTGRSNLTIVDAISSKDPVIAAAAAAQIRAMGISCCGG